MQLTHFPSELAAAVAPSVLPLSRRWSFVVLTLSLVLIFYLDHATGAAPVQHAYYVPIILAGLKFGKRGGMATAIAAVLLYHLANPQLLTLHYEQSDILQIAVFFAVGVTTAQLAQNARRLHRLAMTDDSTGLHNLRSFESHLARLVTRATSRGAPLALLVLDVDRLKSLNDHHGHLAGAEAVKTVGEILARRLPPAGVACRYGGDEFVVALPDCAEPQARAVAHDLCQAVHAESPVLAGVQFPAGTLSISVGVACRHVPLHRAGGSTTRSGRIDPSAGSEGEALFRAADEALYAAKNRGRNRIAVA